MEKARLNLRRTRQRFRNAQHPSHEKRPATEKLEDLKALFALADEMVRAIRTGDIAHNIGHRSHAVHLDRVRIRDTGITLLEDAHLTLFAHRLLCGGHRLRTTDAHRHHHAGKQYEIAHRHDDHGIRRQRCKICFLTRTRRGFAHSRAVLE